MELCCAVASSNPSLIFACKLGSLACVVRAACKLSPVTYFVPYSPLHQLYPLSTV